MCFPVAGTSRDDGFLVFFFSQMSPLKSGSSLDSPSGLSREDRGGRMPVTSHGPLAHLTGVIERVPSDSGVAFSGDALQRRAPLSRAGSFKGPRQWCLPIRIPRVAFTGDSPSFARGSFFHERLSHRHGAYRVSRRTSSVGRGCEALPLRPRWETRGDENPSSNLTPGFRALRDDYTRVIGRFSSLNSSVYLVDPASSHMLVSKIKPCKCQHMPPNG